LSIDAFKAAWYQPWIGLIEEVGWPGRDANHHWLEELNRVAACRQIRNTAGHLIQFKPQVHDPKPQNTQQLAYESAIAQSGLVPTRVAGEGAWHDYFNALIWLSLPLTKSAINLRQAEAIAQFGVSGERGPLRDALTLFDESAVVLIGDDHSQLEHLRHFQWTRLFVDGRSEFAIGTRCLVVGHALLQKLLSPYKAICGQALMITEPVSRRVAGRSHADIVEYRATGEHCAPGIQTDRALAEVISDPGFGKDTMTALPILGIPGWWPANEQAEFYNDPRVFRRKQR
jgi:Protein of unknown function (DUF3025)